MEGYNMKKQLLIHLCLLSWLMPTAAMDPNNNTDVPKLPSLTYQLSQNLQQSPFTIITPIVFSYIATKKVTEAAYDIAGEDKTYAFGPLSFNKHTVADVVASEGFNTSTLILGKAAQNSWDEEPITKDITPGDVALHFTTGLASEIAYRNLAIGANNLARGTFAHSFVRTFLPENGKAECFGHQLIQSYVKGFINSNVVKPSLGIKGFSFEFSIGNDQ